MDKREAKKLGAWVSLLAGACFMAGGLAAAYIAFFMKPETATYLLARVAHAIYKH